MASRRRKKRESVVAPMAGLNLAPLVNMGLILLLILLVTAPSLYIVRLPVSLPKSESGEDGENRWIRVVLSTEEKISVDGEILENWGALLEALKKARQTTGHDSVVLNVDEEVPFSTTSRLLAMLRKNVLGIDIAFGTTPEAVDAN